MGIYFLVMLGFNFFYIAFPIHAVTSLEWTVTETGVFFSVMSLLMVLVQGPLLVRLSKKCSDVALAVIGSCILALSFAFYLSRSDATIYLGTALLALGNGLMWPSVMALLSKAAGEELQGAVQGFASSSGAVASILGLFLGGVLYGWLEARVFLGSAAAIAAVFMMALRLARMSVEPE